MSHKLTSADSHCQLFRQGLWTPAFEEDYVFWFDFYSNRRGKSTGFKCYVIGEAQDGGSAPSTAGPTEPTPASPTTAGPTEPTTASPTTSGPSGPSGNNIEGDHDGLRLDFLDFDLGDLSLYQFTIFSKE